MNDSGPTVLQCPSCGASLPVEDEASLICQYCGNRVLVPLEYRQPHRPEADPVRSEPPAAFTSSEPYSAPARPQVIPVASPQRSFIAVWVALAVLVCVGAGVFLLLGAGERGATQIVSERQEIFSDNGEDQPPVPALPTFTPAAELLLKFGAEGSAEGEMDDARYIAVDPQGNIFVGDYSGGRVQKFDAQGNFLMLINVPAPDDDSEVYTRGIGVDAQGNLYIARNGDILIYNGADGQLLNTIPSGWPETYYDSLLVVGDALYSTNGMAAADDILKLSPQGEVLLHKPDVIESVDKDDPALNMQLAVDSQGQIYVLSNFGPHIYIYDAQGSYLTRFGEQGSGRGQIDLSTNLLAVDRRDRLYVASSFRIDQFDTQGNYMGYTIDVYEDSDGGVPMGMTFDGQGYLYLICNNGKILKYQINSR